MKMDNPWNINSIYELQFFNCPSCIFKNNSKQEIVNHAYQFHPESIDFLTNINDNSLLDIICPWSENLTKIKTEPKDELWNTNFIKVEDPGCSNEPQLHLDSHFMSEYSNSPIENSNAFESNEPFLSEGKIEEPNKKVHEGPKVFKCDKCDKSYNHLSTLRDHIERVHEGIKKHKCIKCNYACSRASLLKKHIETVHDGIKKHKCDHCEKSFGQTWNLKQHIDSVHIGQWLSIFC